MTFAITTGKGSKVPGRTWARTFVFIGFIPVHNDRDMMRLPRNKLILFKSMETRVRGSHQRAWTSVEKAKKPFYKHRSEYIAIDA